LAAYPVDRTEAELLRLDDHSVLVVSLNSETHVTDVSIVDIGDGRTTLLSTITTDSEESRPKAVTDGSSLLVITRGGLAVYSYA
jgi:hypothetical protein